MDIDVAPAALSEILPLREHYRREMQCQIVHDSLHARGFTDPYLFRLDGEVAGYGCVLGFDPEPKDVIKEFCLLPGRRAEALPIFRQLIAVSGARRVEAQTNDALLALLLLDCAREITSETILFADAITTRLALPGASFRRVTPADDGRIFEHHAEPVGDWAIEADGVIVATGDFLLHYNEPWADLHMEVAPPAPASGDAAVRADPGRGDRALSVPGDDHAPSPVSGSLARHPAFPAIAARPASRYFEGATPWSGPCLLSPSPTG